MAKIGRETELRRAERAYQAATESGNRKAEVRWANVIANIYMNNRGAYLDALKWIKKDYDISQEFLPEKDILPACNTLGELHLRLRNFSQALYYQEKHLRLAEAANDLPEQQRASAQLGRTYHEMCVQSEDDHSAGRSAKKYFISAMNLAKNLMENLSKSPFLTEYTDAHNNLGMLEMDLDNLEEAEKLLTRGLKICNEQEVGENDDSRCRLHHNLGIIYMEFRNWKKAQEHIKKAISICKNMRHYLGEAKALVNFGVLYYRVQRYDKAISCYEEAFYLAKLLEGEDALVYQVVKHIDTVKAAIEIMEELKQGEQNIKKSEKNIEDSRGRAHERKTIQEHITSLDLRIEKSRMIFAWKEHLKYAAMKMRFVEELCDKEKIADSFLVIGESNQKLWKFEEALKWYRKSWETYSLIRDFEGQAVSMINMGIALDFKGCWEEALRCFEEGYRIASEANIGSAKLSAMENMHYSYMIRFDNVELARKLKISINNLKHSSSRDTRVKSRAGFCSETESEIESHRSDISEVSYSPVKSVSNSTRSKPHPSQAVLDDDAPLITFFNAHKKGWKYASSSIAPRGQEVGRKRSSSFLSDVGNKKRLCRRSVKLCHGEDSATSSGFDNINAAKKPCEFQDAPPLTLEGVMIASTPVVVKKSYCSNQLMAPTPPARASGNLLVNHQTLNLTSYPLLDGYLTIKIEEQFVHTPQELCMIHDKFSIDQIKVVVACLYYLQLPSRQRESGLVPVVQDIKCDGITLQTLEAETLLKTKKNGECRLEGILGVWRMRQTVKLYSDCCEEHSERPCLKVLKNLFNPEAIEDEIIASHCGLHDVSVAPLLDVLHGHKAAAVIDLSHNILGYRTMERLKQVLLSSKHNCITHLDLHCNRLGSSALCHIIACPVLCCQLQVLNVSGNRLTDSCARSLSIILKKFQGNNSVHGKAIVQLLRKINTLKRFEDLNLTGIKLSKAMIDILCELPKDTYLSGLMVGGSHIGTDEALRVTLSLLRNSQDVKLDLSACGLTPQYILRLNAEVSSFDILVELNLAGNPMIEEGANALASLLSDPECCLRVLVLRECQLGLIGILEVLKSLSQNNHLKELDLGENIYMDGNHNSLPQTSQQHSDCHFVGNLSAAVEIAKHLKMLDLSNNGFRQDVVEQLRAAWSSNSRGATAQTHTSKNVVHLSVQGLDCCRMPCCPRL
ncbi:OLC1v1018568C1 [Oldenlandia corymbosa var. corymbosa]|uniref:OLC1v1018568C1 n=1 Tax=Oldenlandia corymbosa var. corymbosa TaxID=529605 RepID=A0AAV1EC06_OLDCO|nr:OLC1v1018568C1 [Oldenlandia corymbosa var. corymbosa]